MGFHPVTPPMAVRPLAISPRTQSKAAIVTQFRHTTWMAIGAFFQAIIVLFLPRLYALTPTFLFILYKIVDTMLITYGYKRNYYLDNVIPGRASAQVPDLDGEFSGKASDEKIVCLHLGVKINHPMGVFAPHFSPFADHLSKMMTAVEADGPDSGFLGNTVFQALDANGAQEILSVSYWRSLESVHNFAYGPTHHEAWMWYEKMLKLHDMRHVGINHEIFCCDKGQWENVYLNFQPTMLGATTYLRKGDKMIGGVVDDAWIYGLMDAKKGKLRTSSGRLGWQTETLAEKHGKTSAKSMYEEEKVGVSVPEMTAGAEETTVALAAVQA